VASSITHISFVMFERACEIIKIENDDDDDDDNNNNNNNNNRGRRRT